VNIIMPTAMGFFLIWERKWLLLAGFSSIVTGGYALTLLCASPEMRNMIFFVNTAVPFSREVFYSNFLSLVKKTVPVWMLLALYSKKPLQTPALRLSICGLGAWALTLLPASAKVGSAENYHFIALFFLTLWVAACLASLKERSRLQETGLRLLA